MCRRGVRGMRELTLTQKILVRATELIGRPNGWCKLHWYRQTATVDQVCMLGAIGKATTELTGLKLRAGDTVNTQAFNTLIDSVVELVAPFSPMKQLGGRSALSSFNDNHATTQEQVKDVFCKAVKKELGAEDDE